MIDFGFNPDWLGVSGSLHDYKIDDSTLFVRGYFYVDKSFIVPKLIRT